MRNTGKNEICVLGDITAIVGPKIYTFLCVFQIQLFLCFKI